MPSFSYKINEISLTEDYLLCIEKNEESTQLKHQFKHLQYNFLALFSLTENNYNS